MINRSILIAIFIFIVFWFFYEQVHAASGETRRLQGIKVIERKLQRLERTKSEASNILPDLKKKLDGIIAAADRQMQVALKGIENMIEDTKHELCILGASSFCPQIQEPEVSKGHTVKVSFDVIVTRYNPVRSQTDENPCEGSFGNVCVAYEEGLNPVAASRDVAVYPLGKGAKIKLTTSDLRPECKAMDGVIYTVMDTLSDCAEKYRDLRTGRCTKEITNQIDIFEPCDDADCFLGIAKAHAFGVCHAVLTKL